MAPTDSPALKPSRKRSIATREVTTSPHRIKIYFQDDTIRQRSQDAFQQLLCAASSTDTTTNSALLAKKALKYRKVYDRLAGVDVRSPTFDASKFMGVDWCKTQSLKSYCSRTQ